MEMNNSLLVMSYVHQILKNNVVLQEHLNTDKCMYALLANEDTPYPFIVYSRTACTPVYTKDILSDNIINFEINIVSNQYLESITIANIVRNILEGRIIINDVLKTSRILMTGAAERYSDNAYVQTLYFTVRVN